jgi:hypothetical protein
MVRSADQAAGLAIHTGTTNSCSFARKKLKAAAPSHFWRTYLGLSSIRAFRFLYELPLCTDTARRETQNAAGATGLLDIVSMGDEP